MTSRALLRLPEGAGRSLDRCSAASDVPRRHTGASLASPNSLERRCVLQIDSGSSPRPLPRRCSHDPSLVPMRPGMLPAMLGLGARPHLIPERLPSYPVLHISKDALVFPDPRTEAREVYPGRRTPFVRLGRTAHVPKHTHRSPWTRPSPCSKSFGMARRHVGPTFATHLFVFQRRAPASRARPGQSPWNRSSRGVPGKDSLHGEPSMKADSRTERRPESTFAQSWRRALDTAVTSPGALNLSGGHHPSAWSSPLPATQA